MKFKSTREKAPILNFSEALKVGLASDGGLYIPESLPSMRLENFENKQNLDVVAQRVLAPFVEGDLLETKLAEICANALNFKTPLVELDETTSILELFHGPTAAFKDVGARFLAECFARMTEEKKWTVLVATSGDTGGAVASAFHKKPNVEVVILYPKNLVSPFQEKQLTCWGDNIKAFAVRGTFDDCQSMVKDAFQDKEVRKNKNLTSANSINIGRILPQTTYYALASIQYWQKNKKSPSFIVPSGNLGNGLAALWAKEMGFPIGKVVFACNANQTVSDYFKTGKWEARPTIPTLANAMDVGNPSNMERILNLYPTLSSLKNNTECFSVSDSEIRATIRDGKKRFGKIFCPHTATAILVSQKEKGNWIAVATAHPAKFLSIVEPLIGEKVEIPDSLRILKNRPDQVFEIDANFESFKRLLNN